MPLPFTTPAAGAMDSIYRVFGSPAVYTPAVGEPIDCTVIACEPEPDALVQFGATSLSRPARLYELRAAEVPAPAAGDTLTAAGVHMIILAEPRHPAGDTDHALWRLECTTP